MNGGTTNLTPDIPYSFATYSDLSAAVAANGGQSLGPSVSVAGVLWYWSDVGGYEKIGTAPVDPWAYPKKTPRALAAGSGLRVALCGSSSSAISMSLRNAVISKTAINGDERLSGYFFGAQTQNGGGLYLNINLGTDGALTSDIAAQASTLTSSYKDDFDVAVLQFGANDLASQTFDSIKSICIESLSAVIGAGKIAVLVVPHTRNPNPSQYGHIEYAKFRSWCYSQAVAYQGSVLVADHYSVLSNGVDTPPEYLEDAGTHLSPKGARLAGTAWTSIYRSLGVHSTNSSIEQFGDVVQKYDNTWTISNATVSAIGSDGFGRNQWEIVSNANLSNIMKSLTLPAGDGVYRVYVDYDIINPGLSPSNGYETGAKLSIAGIDRRFGLAEGPTGASDIGTYRGMSAPIKASGTSAVLLFFPGSSGAIVRLRECGIIRIP